MGTCGEAKPTQKRNKSKPRMRNRWDEEGNIEPQLYHGAFLQINLETNCYFISGLGIENGSRL